MEDKAFQLKKIFRCIQLLQQRNRTIGAVTRDGLSLLDIHFLTEALINPQLNLSTIAEILCIDKAILSKVISRLSKRKFIKVTKNNADRRLSNISLMRQGIKSLKVFDDNLNRVLDSLSKQMPENEISCITKLFNLVADAMNVPASATCEGEHPLRCAQRRITRALGIMKSQSSFAFGSSEWHVLNEIFESNNSINAQSLSSKLNLAKNSVSHIVASLVSQGHVKQTRALLKKHFKQLAILNKGITVLEETNNQIIELLDAATKNYSPIEVETVCIYFEKYLGYLGNGKVRISETITGKLIDDNIARAQLRSFSVKSLYSLKLAELAPEKFFHDNAICLAFYSKNEIIGAAQIENHKPTARKIVALPAVTFFAGSTIDMMNRMPEIIRKAVRLLSEELKFDEVEFEFSAHSIPAS